MPVQSTILIPTRCPLCGKRKALVVDRLRYQQWRAGLLLVQQAFPDLSADDREALITGIDGECWSLMGEDDDANPEDSG